MLRDTSQLLSKVKPKTPKRWNAGRASAYSRMKKKAISTRISAASAVSPHRSRRSGSRASGDRSRTERPPPAAVRLPASISALLERLAVAGQRLDLGLGRSVDGAGQRRVLQLLRHALSVALRVVQPVLHSLGDGAALPRLAHVLVDEEECGRCDRVSGRARRVDGAEAQVARDLEPLTGRRGRRQCGSDVLARLVLHVGGREVVLQGKRLLDVSDGTLVLLDAGGHAVVALGARAGGPLDRLVHARAVLPGGAVGREEAREQLGGPGLV